MQSNSVKFGNNGNVLWKEDGFGDKFRIIPNFSGSGTNNKLIIQSTTGEAGTDPQNWKDLVTIHADPANLFDGKWEQIKDKFLLSAGDTYNAGDEGGEATHKLTQNEIPNYSIGTIPEAVPFKHNNWNNGGITSGDLGKASSSKEGVANNNKVLTIVSETQWGYEISTNGGNQPHNNMPPYLAVYMWKRTA